MPKFFSLSIVGGEEGNNALKSRLSNLLEIVDVLETEVISPISEHKDGTMEDRGSIDNQNIVNLENNSGTPENEENILKHPIKIEEHGVYGKKCFYFCNL